MQSQPKPKPLERKQAVKRREPAVEPQLQPLEANEPADMDGIVFQVLYDFEPELDDDLRVKRGETVIVKAVRPDGWWLVEADDGSAGLVPRNILEVLPEGEPQLYEEPERVPEVHVQDPTPVPMPAPPAGYERVKREAPEPPAVERRPSRDQDHLSLFCHLFPRLSESNLHFHDVYWNYNAATKKVSLRKRAVKITRFVNVNSVQLDKPGAGQLHSEQFTLELSLLDRRPQSSKQIVSNVHSVDVQFRAGRLGLFDKSSHCTVLVRSNYAQHYVVLKLELFSGTQSARVSNGTFEMALLNEVGQSVLPNRSYSERFGDYRVNFETTDLPSRTIPMADMLPDVLICDARWIPMLATFRQVVAEKLAEREMTNSSTWITDPLVATFPRIDAHLAEMFLDLLTKRNVLTAQPDTAKFRQLYTQFVLPLINTIKIDSRQRADALKTRIEADKDSPIGVLSSQRCAPLNVLDYALHLSGSHALD
ncbi:CBN-NPH-1 protein [Aphelenchoides avenae]|nr:CBN-NPH-1 protein [Aphelenchus avenae]